MNEKIPEKDRPFVESIEAWMKKAFKERKAPVATAFLEGKEKIMIDFDDMFDGMDSALACNRIIRQKVDQYNPNRAAMAVAGIVNMPKSQSMMDVIMEEELDLATLPDSFEGIQLFVWTKEFNILRIWKIEKTDPPTLTLINTLRESIYVKVSLNEVDPFKNPFI